MLAWVCVCECIGLTERVLSVLRGCVRVRAPAFVGESGDVRASVCCVGLNEGVSAHTLDGMCVLSDF